MKAFFDTPAKQARLVAVARRWIGTPFHPHARIRGVGVDCVHLLGAIYQEVGLLTVYQFTGYAMDGGQHQATSQVTDWLDAHPNFQRMTRIEDDLLPGDLVCFRMGRVPHHVGILLNPLRFIHAVRPAGVIESQMTDPTYAKRLAALYRPVR